MTSSSDLDLQQTMRRTQAAGRAIWGKQWCPTRGAMAPGRIEILGNHVDYNGGPVLAAAVDRATVILAGDSDKLELFFADFPDLGVIELDPNHIDRMRSELGHPKSFDYALGVIERAKTKGRSLRSGRLAIASSIPIGSGMSSSAALSVALTLLLNQESPSGVELVYDAQSAENWTGVPCGAMDQSASVFGHVIRYEGPEGTISIEPDLGDYCFVVVDSRVERTLGSSSYPLRVRECAEAVEILSKTWNRSIANLAALTPDDLATIENANPPVLAPTLVARTRHIVTEIQRVSDGEQAMKHRDWERFGALMNASGESSAGDYAISHPRVEALVATMRAVPGVVGARMMGGGEGGSALALLHRGALDDLRWALARFFDDESMSTSTVPLSFAPGARHLGTAEIENLAQ